MAYRTSNGVWLDDLSEYTGRSYASDNGIGYGQQLSGEQGGDININLRARIRTVNPVVCDFDADGKTGRADVAAVVRLLRGDPGNPQADFNRDGSANVADALALILALRGGTCPE